jgi:NifB/MoaA-like Fe-S oxidoreductase
MAEDIIAALREQGAGDVALLPRVVFDHPERISLDDQTPAQVAQALGAPVVLADTMGDVWDALLGESSVVYR